MSFTFQADTCKISLGIQGQQAYQKMSFPTHCGVYSEIDTPEFTFHFNLNNEIIRCKSKCSDWGHPHEWLKRTTGNDWIYYSTGGYTGVFEATGEYYLPNFNYSSNSMLGGKPFAREEVHDLASHWYSKLEAIIGLVKDCPTEIQSFLDDVQRNTPMLLQAKADELFAAIGGQISVLPPDGRHVDYNLIPLIISEGCLYKCRFCKVKNTNRFKEKSAQDITRQINFFKSFYAQDIGNQNSLFLGEHDALLSSSSLILDTIDVAFKAFAFQDSYLLEKNIFLFGSASSLLNCGQQLFHDLQALPANTYINVGLESADKETLDIIGKPISEKIVTQAFQRIQEINEHFSKIEITCNFIMGDELPRNHYPKIIELIRDRQSRSKPKGTIYFSPLIFDKPSRARLFEFNRLKLLSRFPTYLYIIQRL